MLSGETLTWAREANESTFYTRLLLINTLLIWCKLNLSLVIIDLNYDAFIIINWAIIIY